MSPLGEIQSGGGFPTAGIEHVTMHLALLDELQDFRLRLPDAPRWPSGELLGRLTAIGGFEHILQVLGHAFTVPGIPIYVNAIDIDAPSQSNESR